MYCNELKNDEKNDENKLLKESHKKVNNTKKEISSFNVTFNFIGNGMQVMKKFNSLDKLKEFLQLNPYLDYDSSKIVNSIDNFNKFDISADYLALWLNEPIKLPMNKNVIEQYLNKIDTYENDEVEKIKKKYIKKYGTY